MQWCHRIGAAGKATGKLDSLCTLLDTCWNRRVLLSRFEHHAVYSNVCLSDVTQVCLYSHAISLQQWLKTCSDGFAPPAAHSFAATALHELVPGCLCGQPALHAR